MNDRKTSSIRADIYSNFGGAGTPPSAHRAIASGAGNFDHRSKIMRMAGSEEPCGLTGACTARPAQAGPGLGPAGPAAGPSPYGALARRPVERREHGGRDQPDQYPARTDRWRGVPTTRRAYRRPAWHGISSRQPTGMQPGPECRLTTTLRLEPPQVRTRPRALRHNSMDSENQAL